MEHKWDMIYTKIIFFRTMKINGIQKKKKWDLKDKCKFSQKKESFTGLEQKKTVLGQKLLWCKNSINNILLYLFLLKVKIVLIWNNME